MTQQLHPGVPDGDLVGFGEIVAVVGETYLIGLAILILIAALTNVAGLPAGIRFIPIGDPAMAAAFTA